MKQLRILGHAITECDEEDKKKREKEAARANGKGKRR